MSLLMDALKRAEKARQAEDARKQVEQGAEGESSQELTLEAMGEDERAAGVETIASDVRPDLPKPSGLALEDTSDMPLVDSGEMRAVEAEIMSGRASLDSNLEDTDSWDLSALQTDAPVDLGEPPAAGGGGLRDSAERSLDYGGLPLDETSATLPSMRAAQRSVDDYFDGTHSMSMSMDDVRGAATQQDPGDTDDQTYTDTTRRTARALLEGDLPGRTRRTGVIVAAVLIPLFLIVLGGGAYLFKDEIMLLVDGPKQTLARRPPPQRAPAPTRAAAPATAPGQGTTVGRSTGAGVVTESPARATTPATAAVTTTAQGTTSAGATGGSTVQPSAEEQAAFVAAAQALAGGTSTTTDATGAVAGTIDTGVAKTAAKAQTATAASETGTMTAPRASDQAAAASEVGLDDVLRNAGPESSQTMASVDLEGALADSASSGLKITRRRGPGRIQRLVRRGYDAYQAGDDGASARAYQRVLRARPGNRDAMLGMAAIYMRGGALEQAQATYAQILRRNPRDAAALSGMLAIDRGADPTASESKIKTLLADRPQDPQLHFTLGNLYAQQSRWAEAQQAYFEAHRFEPANPDYAFNLAVALDQLRQGKAAADYYRRALELYESGASAAFDAIGVRSRLAELGRAG